MHGEGIISCSAALSMFTLFGGGWTEAFEQQNDLAKLELTQQSKLVDSVLGVPFTWPVEAAWRLHGSFPARALTSQGWHG